MTTGQAARALGIASLNTIKSWVRAGLLEGFQRGGRVMVSRASVERPLSPITWTGRTPWGKGIGAS
jgi:hypothetical protein